MLVISLARRALGHRPGEQIGRRLTEALPGEVGGSPRTRCAPSRPAASRCCGLEPAVEAGRERGWLIHVYPLDYEGRELVAVVALDVTESRRAHERLQRDAGSARHAPSGWRASAPGAWDVTADRLARGRTSSADGGPEPGPRRPRTSRRCCSDHPRGPRRDARGDDARAARRPALRDPLHRAARRRAPPVLRGRGVARPRRRGRVVRVDGFAQDVTELARAESASAPRRRSGGWRCRACRSRS